MDSRNMQVIPLSDNDIEEQLTNAEAYEDGGPMCLPGCSDRSYTSKSTLVGFTASFLCSAILLGSSALILVLSPLFPEGDERNTNVKLGLGIGGAGLLGAVNTGILFFCGTRKNQKLENAETNSLIPAQTK